jgi:O-antigen/teichoic acid export membrane protein
LAVVTSAAAGVAAYLIALVAAILVAHVQLGRLLDGHAPEPVDRRAVMRFGVGSLLFAFAVASFQSVDMLLVKHYFSDHEAGLYGAALTVGRAIFLLVIPFRLVALPRLARREDSPGSRFSSLCGLYIVLAGPLLVALWLWPEQLLTGLLGIEYSGAEQVLPILAFAFFFGSLAVLLAQPLMAASDFRFLYLYVAALAGEMFFLATAHSSLTTIAVIVLCTQVFAAMGTGVWAWHGFRKTEVG